MIHIHMLLDLLFLVVDVVLTDQELIIELIPSWLVVVHWKETEGRWAVMSLVTKYVTKTLLSPLVVFSSFSQQQFTIVNGAYD